MAAVAPDGLDWDFAERYPYCKSWLEIIPPKQVDGNVQYGTRVTQAEWEAGKQQRITKWYRSVFGDGSSSDQLRPLTYPILDLWKMLTKIAGLRISTLGSLSGVIFIFISPWLREQPCN
jgi:hypothetical protein